MRRRPSSGVFALGVAGIVTMLDGAARGEGPFPEPSPSLPAPRERIEGHRLFATFELLGLAVGQVAAQVETPISRRNTLALNGFYLRQEMKGDPGVIAVLKGTAYDTKTEAGGVDFQWRHYLGDGTPSGRGFYLAPGLELQRFSAVTADCEEPGGFFSTVTKTTCGNGRTQSWWYYGPSLDLGGQFVASFGLVLGVAVGAQYRFATENVAATTRDWAWSAMNGEGLRPRLRFTAGWAFL